MIINSLDNARVKLWTKLHQKKYREQYGLFIVEEKHLIEEAIQADMLDTLIVREGRDNPFDREAVVVSDGVMKKLSENVSLNECIGICKISPARELKGSSFIILEKVQNPGNVGTIIRTAYSLGYDAVLLSEGCASPYSHKTIQSSQGALFHIPLVEGNIEDLIGKVKKLGCRVYATTLDSSRFLQETVITDKYALMLGNEGQGLSDMAVSLSDENVKIEMRNFESLNVAIAMGITAYWFKQKK
ncbi:MAG: RNA methyltransferase [Erysipelotrichaceae bacterium]|nr:RNA methyltransferase [Erysipelotrichaceae bacterium]